MTIIITILSSLVWLVWTLFMWVPRLRVKIPESIEGFLLPLWWGIHIFGGVAVLMELGVNN